MDSFKQNIYECHTIFFYTMTWKIVKKIKFLTFADLVISKTIRYIAVDILPLNYVVSVQNIKKV